jgi:hypothetical protein
MHEISFDDLKSRSQIRQSAGIIAVPLLAIKALGGEEI